MTREELIEDALLALESGRFSNRRLLEWVYSSGEMEGLKEALKIIDNRLSPVAVNPTVTGIDEFPMGRIADNAREMQAGCMDPDPERGR